MKKIISFLVLASVFAGVHLVAVKSSLYWYFWWFDSVMHFSGGLLLGLGFHALADFFTYKIVFNTSRLSFLLVLATVSWEVFERVNGLYDPSTYVFDTIKDLVLGISGGLLAHYLLMKNKK